LGGERIKLTSEVYESVAGWLRSVKKCSVTRKCLHLTGIEIDVAGARIIKPIPQRNYYSFEGIAVYLVEVKSKWSSAEKHRLLGQLQDYSKTVNDLTHCPLPSNYGAPLQGPDELHVYACVPENAEIDIKDLIEETGAGLLTFSLDQAGNIFLNEIIESQNQSKSGFSTKVKQNLALFDLVCKEHPLYRKLLSDGRALLSKCM